MKIKMIGIDYRKASLKVRELFSFTKKESREILLKLNSHDDVNGCAVISTCNRTEIWLSCEKRFHQELIEILCEIKGVNEDLYSDLFVCRQDETAVKHLFLLAAGMKSQILGEDQILTQIKEAISYARELYCTDHVIEVLFRMAITSGKLVKSNIKVPKSNTSAAHQAIASLKKQGEQLKGKNCLVIGNGELGKITALALLEEKANVTVTVRQYRSGIVEIPPGCSRIHYAERYHEMEKRDFIFSATSSPNKTITEVEVKKHLPDRQLIFVDLAVPRDIDTNITEQSGITLYDIDSFQIPIQSESMQKQYENAENLLGEKVQEFIDWYECKDVIKHVTQISKSAAEDVSWRTKKTMKKLSLIDEQQTEMKRAIDEASEKVVNKLFFEIRDHVSTKTFLECVDVLYQIHTRE